MSYIGSNKYFTKDILIHANNAAIREKRNKYFSKDFIDSLPEERLFLVIDIFNHTRDEIRVIIGFDENGTRGYLDMSDFRFNTLPTVEFKADRCIILEPSEITESKKPYPNREWQESVYLKPVRKQSKFRNEVLIAYNYQCALCSIKNKSLLRAAHIIPVIKSGDDTVKNGICLCINHEVAFDRSILKIHPNGNVEVDTNEDIKVENNKIRLPKDKDLYSSKKYLKMRIDGEF